MQCITLSDCPLLGSRKRATVTSAVGCNNTVCVLADPSVSSHATLIICKVSRVHNIHRRKLKSCLRALCRCLSVATFKTERLGTYTLWEQNIEMHYRGDLVICAWDGSRLVFLFCFSLFLVYYSSLWWRVKCGTRVHLIITTVIHIHMGWCVLWPR